MMTGEFGNFWYVVSVQFFGVAYWYSNKASSTLGNVDACAYCECFFFYRANNSGDIEFESDMNVYANTTIASSTVAEILEESADWALLSHFCDDSNLPILISSH